MFLKYLFEYFLNLLFPKYCAGCDKEGTYLCDRCEKSIILLKHATCPECKKLTKIGQYCGKHKSDYLNGIIIACYFHKGALRELIHQLKYNNIKEISKILARLATQRIKNMTLPKGWKKWIIIPVPLHRKRIDERGYNQARLLAKYLAAGNELKIIDKELLIRKKYTTPQVQLLNKDRFKNIINSFDWVGKKNDLKGKTILLVDDVATTGSTLIECAKILKNKAGAYRVYGLVIAKG